MRRRQCYWKSANTFNSACFIKKCKNEKVIIYFPKFGQMSNTYCPKHWSFFLFVFFSPPHPPCTQLHTTDEWSENHCSSRNNQMFRGENLGPGIHVDANHTNHPPKHHWRTSRSLMAVALEWPHSPKTCKHFSPHCHSRCVKWFLIQKCFRLQLKSIWYFW